MKHRYIGNRMLIEFRQGPIVSSHSREYDDLIWFPFGYIKVKKKKNEVIFKAHHKKKKKGKFHFFILAKKSLSLSGSRPIACENLKPAES